MAAAGAAVVSARGAARLAVLPGVTLMTGVEPGVGDVAGPGVAGPGAAGVTVTKDLGEGDPPPMVNCAKALSASRGVNERMANWRNVFMKGLSPE